MSVISSYFSRTRLKRNHSSTSDESDVSISSENDSKKQEKKCMNTVVVEDSDMVVQAALDNISKHLDTLATKVDVEQMRDEVPDQDFHGEVGEARGVVVWHRDEGR